MITFFSQDWYCDQASTYHLHVKWLKNWHQNNIKLTTYNITKHESQQKWITLIVLIWLNLKIDISTKTLKLIL